MIFRGGYQPPTVAKATYFFVPKTSQNVICGKTIPQTTLPSNAAGILSNRGGSLRTAKSGRSGLMLFPKDGEHRQQIYILFSSTATPKKMQKRTQKLENCGRNMKYLGTNILEIPGNTVRHLFRVICTNITDMIYASFFSQ